MAPKKNSLIKEICPPIIWKAMRSLRANVTPRAQYGQVATQDLSVYWDDEMAAILDTWGEGNVWNEIQFLMSPCSGRVLDIACGTGKVMSLLNSNPHLVVFGCDISDKLIDKALQRGTSGEFLKVCDATSLPYGQNYFDYSYSIGSLEHFTEVGISDFISEAARVTRIGSYHMMPTSKSNKNEGWLKTYQSFHNNSEDWWISKFKQSFGNVRVLSSSWSDPISVGSWFICTNPKS